jgi:hypothetical protein
VCVHDSYRLAGAPLGQPMADRGHATELAIAHQHTTKVTTSRMYLRGVRATEPHQPKQRLEQRCETLFLGGVVDQERGQLQRLHDGVSCTPARVIVVQTLAVVHVLFLVVVVAHLDNQRAL